MSGEKGKINGCHCERDEVERGNLSLWNERMLPGTTSFWARGWLGCARKGKIAALHFVALAMTNTFLASFTLTVPLRIV